MMQKNLKAIQIQTIDYCNRNCSFCPNVPEHRTRKKMDIDLYRKILIDLKEIRFSGRISPYLMNEPLSDDRLVEIIELTRLYFPSNQIAINTNGDFIWQNKELVNELFKAGLNILLINLYDEEDTSLKLRKFLEETLKFEDVIWLDSNVKVLDKKIFPVHAIRIRHIPKALPTFWNRGGNVPSVERKESLRKKYCDLIFKQMYINYRGDVLLCCSDWKNEVIMGNVSREKLLNIWNGPLYDFYRRSHLNLCIEKLPLCKSCNRILPK